MTESESENQLTYLARGIISELPEAQERTPYDGEIARLRAYPKHHASQYQTRLGLVRERKGYLRCRQEELERVKELMDALKDHLTELACAWRRGALSEHDGKGGTRSNRNHDLIWSIARYREGSNEKK